MTSYKVIFAEFGLFNAVFMKFIARIGGLALSLAVMVDFAGSRHLLSFGVCQRFTLRTELEHFRFDRSDVVHHVV